MYWVFAEGQFLSPLAHWARSLQMSEFSSLEEKVHQKPEHHFTVISILKVSISSTGFMESVKIRL